MDIPLTPEMENFINSKVESGRYLTPGEVVREGLLLMQQRDEIREVKLRALRAEIQIGIDELDAGLGLDGPTVMAEKRARLLRMKETNG